VNFTSNALISQLGVDELRTTEKFSHLTWWRMEMI